MSSSTGDASGVMRADRVIALIDMDCFYAQVEQRLQPALWGKPVAVVQYNQYKGGGIIAVNYEARAFGVRRMGMRGDEARALCPELTLCEVPMAEHASKADLARYRDASAEVFKVLNEFDPRIVVERASIDEAFLDLTPLVDTVVENEQLTNQMLNSSDAFPTTHVATGDDVVDGKSGEETAATSDDPAADAQRVEETAASRVPRQYDRDACLKRWLEGDARSDNLQTRLALGAEIVERIRTRIRVETQFHCSAGIGTNKMIAKLVCSRHKPGQQTIIPPQNVTAIYRNTPISKVRNLGGKLGSRLKSLFDIKMMADLARVPSDELRAQFGRKTAEWLQQLAAGEDTEAVKARDKLQSIAAGRNFPGKTALATVADVSDWLRALSKELGKRLIEDQVQNQRTAQTLAVGCSQEGEHSSRQCPLVSYDSDAVFNAAFTALKTFNKAKDPSTSWSPPITNLSLSGSRFRPGVSTVTQTITQWVSQRLDQVEERRVKDDGDQIPVYKTTEQYTDFVRKRESRWQEYERVQAMPGGAVPEKREEIPREILDNLPADIKHELNHFYNLKEAKASKQATSSGSGSARLPDSGGNRGVSTRATTAVRGGGRKRRAPAGATAQNPPSKASTTMKISHFFGGPARDGVP